MSRGPMESRAGRCALQRLFSSFPDGVAGLGLLLLRLTVGGALVGEGALAARGGALASWNGALAVVAILSGGALVAGVLTPAASVAASALCLGYAFAAPAGGWPGLDGAPALALLFVMGVAVALMGPGAFSVDCRLFGRREIVVPRPRSGGSRNGATFERGADP